LWLLVVPMSMHWTYQKLPNWYLCKHWEATSAGNDSTTWKSSLSSLSCLHHDKLWQWWLPWAHPWTMSFSIDTHKDVGSYQTNQLTGRNHKGSQRAVFRMSYNHLFSWQWW
jgi:hypothetical protein